jgi:hypothetical protein
MTDIYDSLKTYVEKIGRSISELQEVEGELQVILNNKILLNKLDFELNYSDLKNIITRDPKEEMSKESLEEDKNSLPIELSDTVDALDLILNDDEMWARRKEEHEKYSHQKFVKVKTIELNKSDVQDNMKDSGVLEPLPVKTKVKELLSIRPLTLITSTQRQKLLYNIYNESLSNVESLGKEFTEEEKCKLVSEESDKLLNIWIKNH